MLCPFLFSYLIFHLSSSKLCFLLLKRNRKEPHILIHCPDLLHFLFRKFKVKDVKIIFDMLRIGRFREDNRTLLDMPAQDDLNISLSILFCQLCKYRFIYQVCIAMSE